MTSRFLTIAAAITVALSACAETAPDDDQSAYGSITAAITAPGAGGAVYRLPAGTYVQAFSATFNDAFSLDGDSATVAFDVPIGDYQLFLAHANGYTTDWPLERTNADMTTETVSATLLTPIPVAVAVLEDQTSSVAFQFQVVGGGTVTFAQGTIEISVEVTETEGTAGRLEIGDHYVVSDQGFDAAAPADLPSRLPVIGDNVFQEIYVQVEGDWTQLSTDVVCSSATFAGGYASSSIYNLATEVWVGGTSRLCLYGGDYSPYMYLETVRQGAATTSTFSSYPVSEYFFTQNIQGGLATAVFDGQTLDLDGLAGTHAIAATAANAVYASNGGGGFQNWYYDYWSPTNVILRFLPQP